MGIRARRGLLAVFVTTVCLALAALMTGPADAHHDGPLAGQWHLDSASGAGPQSTPDSSGHALDASASTITLTSAGRWDSHLSSANTTILNAGPSTLLAPAQVTLMAWVKHSGTPAQLRYIAGRGGEGPAQGCTGSSYALYTGVAGNVPLSFYVSTVGGGGAASPVPSAAAVWDGNWHLVAGTYDGAAVRLYVDGVAVGAGTPHSAAINYTMFDNDFTIDGYAAAGCGNTDFPGGIDEVRVYDRALSAAEIGRLAAASATPPVLVADDFAAPETTITLGPADGEVVADAPPVFAFASSEAGSHFECRAWDPAKQSAPAFAACSSPYQVPIPPTQLAFGERTTFEVRAIDTAGNSDATPASRTYQKHKEAAKGPEKLKCEEVDIVSGQGKLVQSGCRLAQVERGTVPCVKVKNLKITRCTFGRRSGSFVVDRDRARWAVAGQAITKKGKTGGPFVIAVPLEKTKVPCADVPRSVLDRIHGRDTTGTTSSVPASGACTVEKLNVPYNRSGAPLENFATREVCTSTYPHPDGATLTRVKAPGVYCYTGRGAALNDVTGRERGPNGEYLVQSYHCHMAVLSSTYSLWVAKRPANAGATINEHSPLIWRPVAPIPIAN